MFALLLCIVATTAASAVPPGRGPRHPVRLPYTPCGGSCTSDGFAAGGVPGVWVGQVCPAKCAECQSDGVLPPAPPNASLPKPLPKNHMCQTSPNQLYQQTTYLPSPVFKVSAQDDHAQDSLPFTLMMRNYIGKVHYVQIVAPMANSTNLAVAVQLLPGSASAIPTPTDYSLKPARHVPAGTKFDRSTNTIHFNVTRPSASASVYLVFRFSGSAHALFLFIEPAPALVLNPPAMSDPGTVSVLDLGVHGCYGSTSSQGDAIQAAINKVVDDEKYHTLVFPFGGPGHKATEHCTYLTHDLRIANSSKKLTLYFEEGVLLQRDGGHIGEYTSPGFFTIFNSSGVSLRGYGTLDALNGGQGLYISSSADITIDGLTSRNSWWWNTEVEHSHGVNFWRYKIVNDPLFSQYQNDGLNLEHSSAVIIDQLFVSSQDDLQCIKADPEDGFNLEGSYTPDIFDIQVSNMLGFNSGSMSMKVGWGATARHMGNISYDRIDIVNNYADSSRASSVGVVIGFDVEITHKDHPVLCQNFTFSNIHYESQRLFIQNPVDFARIRDVVFENITAEAGDFHSIKLVGGSPEYGIANVAFRNVRIGGKLLTKAAMTQGMAVKNAENITFENDMHTLQLVYSI